MKCNCLHHPADGTQTKLHYQILISIKNPSENLMASDFLNNFLNRINHRKKISTRSFDLG